MDIVEAIDQNTLASIYAAKSFLQSDTLAMIAPVLATGNGRADDSKPFDSAEPRLFLEWAPGAIWVNVVESFKAGEGGRP